MQIRELSVPGAFELVPEAYPDDRGVFFEWYRFEQLEAAVGHRLDLRQANASVSRRGVVRGIHYALVPPSQAKYVTCTRGAVIDYAVDVRVGSPTFGAWDQVRLDDADHRAIYLSEGLGHCFVALTDQATVTYLCSAVYAPGREFGISPADPDVGLVWPAELSDRHLSPKDSTAPTLGQAAERGLLPTWDECQEYYRTLSEGDRSCAESSWQADRAPGSIPLRGVSASS